MELGEAAVGCLGEQVTVDPIPELTDSVGEFGLRSGVWDGFGSGRSRQFSNDGSRIDSNARSSKESKFGYNKRSRLSGKADGSVNVCTVSFWKIKFSGRIWETGEAYTVLYWLKFGRNVVVGAACTASGLQKLAGKDDVGFWTGAQLL
jgi:hypothetical protein